MNKYKAARHRCSDYRANVEKHDKDILAAYEQYTLYAGVILGIAFGVMLGVGLC